MTTKWPACQRCFLLGDPCQAMRHELEDLAVSLDALQQLVSSSLGPLGEPMTDDSAHECHVHISWAHFSDHLLLMISSLSGLDKVIETDAKTILVSSAGADLLQSVAPSTGLLSLVMKSIKVRCKDGPKEWILPPHELVQGTGVLRGRQGWSMGYASGHLPAHRSEAPGS